MACTKVTYRSRNAAVAAQRRLDRKKGLLLHVYQCRSCGRWHLGNDRETRLENLNRAFDRLPMSDRVIPSTPPETPHDPNQ